MENSVGLPWVPDPDSSDSQQTVFDAMRAISSDRDYPEKPTVYNIGGGSDYYGFEKRLGIPCIAGGYGYDYDTFSNLSFYPLYHTQYETFRLMESFIDPDFKFHQAVGRTFAEIARNLAESLLLPFDMVNLAYDLDGMLYEMENTTHSQRIVEHNIDLGPLTEAIFEFISVSEKFQDRVNSMDPPSEIQARQINDQMMLLNKAFLGDLPGSTLDRHLLYSLRETDSGDDNIASFPGILDALHEIDDDPDQRGRWEVVAKQVAGLTHAVEAASSVLRDVVLW